MRFQFEDMFEPQQPDSPEKLKEINDKLDNIGKAARKCVASSEFNQYKSMFEEELQNIMNAMVIYTANFGKSGNENLEIYAVNMIRFVQRITDLRKLLTYVEKDAKVALNGEPNGKE